MSGQGPRVWGWRDEGGGRVVTYQVGDPLRGEVYYAEVTSDHLTWRRGGTRGPLIYEAWTTGDATSGEPAALSADKLVARLGAVERKRPGQKRTGRDYYPFLRVGGLRGPLHREDGPAVMWADGREGWYLRGRPISPFRVMTRLEIRRGVAQAGPSDYDAKEAALEVMELARSVTHRFGRDRSEADLMRLARRLKMPPYPSDDSLEDRAGWLARLLLLTFKL